MKVKWRGLYTILEVTACGWLQGEDKHMHCLKTHFPPIQVKCYYRGMMVQDSDEECRPCPCAEAEG